jgi:tRNA-2-methylthio-N6-dimethylallyladenosine synthase
MAQNLKKELTDSQPLVDLIVGPDGYRQLPGMLRKAWQGLANGEAGRQMAVDLSEYETYEGILPERTPGVNAWIAVMRGCDNFCTFCVVPYTRGRERSREPESILHETRILAEQGHKQVTLLGQNVNSYRYDGWDFARLITAVADVPGIERVRFTSPHPKDFPVPLLEAIAHHPRICKHIHLPLQAGNDGIGLTTDLICGFCSESEHEFQDTLSLVETVRFHSAFIFKYSERKNTIAARKYPDDVPEQVKGDRVTRLVEAQRRISLALNQSRIGQTVSVLVEGDAKKSSSQWMGKTDDNLTVVWDKTQATDTAPGQFRSIIIDGATAATLFGREVSADPPA